MIWPAAGFDRDHTGRLFPVVTPDTLDEILTVAADVTHADSVDVTPGPDGTVHVTGPDGSAATLRPDDHGRYHLRPLGWPGVPRIHLFDPAPKPQGTGLVGRSPDDRPRTSPRPRLGGTRPFRGVARRRRVPTRSAGPAAGEMAERPAAALTRRPRKAWGRPSSRQPDTVGGYGRIPGLRVR